MEAGLSQTLLKVLTEINRRTCYGHVRRHSNKTERERRAGRRELEREREGWRDNGGEKRESE